MYRHLLLVVVGATTALTSACSGGGGGDGPTYGDDHPRIYLGQNKARLTAALADHAGQRFLDIVDLQLGGADIYGFEGWHAALIGQLTGDAKYCAYAIDEVDRMVQGEEAKIAAGEVPDVAGDSYLHVGGMVGDVMLTYDWCFDAVANSQRARWLKYARQAVWNIWHPDDAEWDRNPASWSGWSIDNPSNNYYYSFLRATMLFGLATHGEDADAAGWLDFFRDDKIGNQLVPIFDADLIGGGSREGTGYGVAMMGLWELFDFWQASTSQSLAELSPQPRESMLLFLHQTVPTLDRFAPIGDQSRDSTASLFDYHRHYVQELTYLFPDDPVTPSAKYFLSHSSVPEMDTPFMYVFDLLYETPSITEQPLDSLGTAYYASGVGQVYARSGWDQDATWVNMIAGPYTESHAHRDQGSFMLYKGGWLAYDAIVETHSGIRQEEDLHNLVRISRGDETVEMHNSEDAKVVGLARGAGWLHVAADLSPVYGDSTKVERELVYLEPDVVVVFDRVTSSGNTTQTWQLNSPARPTIEGAGATIAGQGHTLHVTRLLPDAATSSVKDWTSDSDFGGGFRLDNAIAGGTNTFLHVLSIDDASSEVVRTEVDGAGRVGATITLKGGGTATVRFSPTSVDGVLELGGETHELKPVVATLPR